MKVFFQNFWQATRVTLGEHSHVSCSSKVARVLETHLQAPLTPSEKHQEIYQKIPGCPRSWRPPWTFVVSLPVSLRGSYGILRAGFRNSSYSHTSSPISTPPIFFITTFSLSDSVFETQGEKPKGSRAVQVVVVAALKPSGIYPISKTEFERLNVEMKKIGGLLIGEDLSGDPPSKFPSCVHTM
jgi:hypothetical protein